jgi:thiol-disulfide isomerase/thioredoxin
MPGVRSPAPIRRCGEVAATEKLRSVIDEFFGRGVLGNEKAVVVDFWAEWCAPRHLVAPELEQLADEYDDKIEVVRLDIEEDPDVAGRYKITSVLDTACVPQWPRSSRRLSVPSLKRPWCAIWRNFSADVRAIASEPPGLPTTLTRRSLGFTSCSGRVDRPVMYLGEAGQPQFMGYSSDKGRHDRCMTAPGFEAIAVMAAEGLPTRPGCRVLAVSESGFYAWRSRLPSARAARRAWLTDTIAQIHATSNGVYGSPRVHAEHRLACGIVVGHGTVEKLMRHAGIKGLPYNRPRRTVPQVSTADDLVDRDFHQDAPNRLRVTDITKHPTHEGKVYCCVIPDAYA